MGAAESDGTDFFNVFTLAAPDGQIAGRAYKTNAEASIFRRGRAAHLIDTPAGRIGIGICADNQFAATLRLMHEQRADLILMPHAWPTPARAARLVSRADVAAQQRRMTELPVLHARALGVPVVFVNQVGPLLPIDGILGHLMDPRIWRLRGQSRIVDCDGSVLGQLARRRGPTQACALRSTPSFPSGRCGSSMTSAATSAPCSPTTPPRSTCRLVPGTNVWAQHAYGLAVDINPFENPEIQGGQVDPTAAAAWADRSRVSPAMIKDGDAAWRAFRAIGWTWGGDWRSLKDYMHFSANGL